MGPSNDSALLGPSAPGSGAIPTELTMSHDPALSLTSMTHSVPRRRPLVRAGSTSRRVGHTRISRALIFSIALIHSACALAIPEPAELCASPNAPQHCATSEDDANAEVSLSADQDSESSEGEADGATEEHDASDSPDSQADADILDAAPGDADPSLVDDVCEALIGARVIELFVDPEGADVGAEFVEIWLPVPSEGLVELAFYNGDNPTPYMTTLVPDGLGELRVLGAGGSVPLPGTIQNGPDSVSLRVCGQLLQTVTYSGVSNQSVDVDPGAEQALSVSGVSSVRCPAQGELADPMEADDAAPSTVAEWGLATPTPGAETMVFLDGTCAAPCQPIAEGSAWINEVRYDPPGADGGGEAEFIELMASRSIDWSTLSIETINGSNGEPYGEAFVLDGVGRWAVVGGDDVPYVTHGLTRAMQNGPDGLLLLSCGDHIVDAVFYGDAPSGGSFEGAPAADVSGPSIGRDRWGTDTNDNASDFAELPRITPGAPNF
ncbi:MAG: hypothetical protein ACI81R_000759 [Bradymonadia bacterium]|jgi:hypothetical protein